MSTATVENPRTKLAKLNEQLESLRARKAFVSVRLAELPSLEHEARIAALRANPDKRTTGLNAEPTKLAEEARKLERELASLEAEIAAAEAVAQERAVEVAREELTPIAEQFEAMTEEEQAAWAGLIEAVVAGNDHWKAIVRIAEGRDRMRLDTEPLIAEDFTEPADRIRAAWNQFVAPFPVDYATALRLAYEAVFDPAGFGYRQGGRSPWARANLLPIAPDLRGDTPSPNLSGRVEKVRLSSEPGIH